MARKMDDQSLISKARKINEVLSRLWYIVLNCVPEERHTSKVQGLINRLLWNTKTPMVAREIYTRPFFKPGGLGAPDAKTRMEAITCMWIPIYLQGKLSRGLEEYMREACTSIGKELDATPIKTSDSLWEGILKIKEAIKSMENDPMKKLKKLKVYAPMKRAIIIAAEMIAEETEEVDEATAEKWTVKAIYKRRMARAEQKSQDALKVDQMPRILSGQEKWMEENGVDNWGYLWGLATRCVNAKEDELHDGLYNAIKRRLVTPTTIPQGDKKVEKNSKQHYTKCTVCKKAEWVTTHALIDCEDTQEIWKTQLGKTTTVTAKDMFQVDESGNIKDRYISYGKKGEKKKATLSAKEITVLATLKEVVDVVKKRAKKKKGEWEKKTSQEWREKIQRRVEGSKKKQKERREERVEKEKKSGIG
jgi:hypothetical protein